MLTTFETYTMTEILRKVRVNSEKSYLALGHTISPELAARLEKLGLKVQRYKNRTDISWRVYANVA